MPPAVALLALLRAAAPAAARAHEPPTPSPARPIGCARRSRSRFQPLLRLRRRQRPLAWGGHRAHPRLRPLRSWVCGGT